VSDDASVDLRWSVVEPRDGVRVHGYFFFKHMFATHDAVRRMLPVFSGALPEPVHAGDSEFRLGRLIGLPAGVYMHGDGLLSLTEAVQSPDHTLDNWRELLEPQDIWVALANAVTVSASMRKPAAALLRASGALYFLAPTDESLHKLMQVVTATEEDGATLTAAEVAQRCLSSV